MFIQKIINGDIFNILDKIKKKSIHLIICDPPFYQVVEESWDNQWKTENEYLEWLDSLCSKLNQLLVPGGALYIFNSQLHIYRVQPILEK